MKSDFLDEINPELIFFFHWSWKIPLGVINKYKCICFHMVDVSYGHSGSQLQNLIIGGHKKTKPTAMLMAEEFATG